MAELILPAHYHGGAFGIVVCNAGNGLCTKVFRRASADIMSLDGRPWENDLRRETFQAEAGAYMAAMTSPVARRLVPEFYGVTTLARVVDAGGKDVSDDFLLDCCLTMEFVPERFEKLVHSGSLIVSSDEYERVVDVLGAVGIRYIADASVALDHTRNVIMTVIDFAISDAYQEGELRRL